MIIICIAVWLLVGYLSTIGLFYLDFKKYGFIEVTMESILVMLFMPLFGIGMFIFFIQGLQESMGGTFFIIGKKPE